MNTITKNDAYNNTAVGIFELLNEIKNKQFEASNKTAFMNIYKNLCKTKKIAAYAIETLKYLTDKNLIRIKGTKCFLADGFALNEIYDYVEKYNIQQNQRNDRNKNSGKSNIKREIFRSKGKTVETTKTPISEYLKKMSVTEFLQHLDNSENTIRQVVNWLRNQNVILKAVIQKEL